MAQTIQYNDLLKKIDMQRLPRHIAIIMDGNGRWAQARNLPRNAGHKAGAENLSKITELCCNIGISTLSVYAFSTENWQRPQKEVGFLMQLIIEYLKKEAKRMNKQGVKLGFLGSKDGLPDKVRAALAEVQESTAANQKMTLNIAINYGARDEIVRAVRNIVKLTSADQIVPEEIDEATISQMLDTAGQDDPDLLIRPSGEKRISNFLLWQSAYSEFYFSDLFWPDFGQEEMLKAIIDYQGRNRRFGKTTEQIKE